MPSATPAAWRCGWRRGFCEGLGRRSGNGGGLRGRRERIVDAIGRGGAGNGLGEGIFGGFGGEGLFAAARSHGAGSRRGTRGGGHGGGCGFLFGAFLASFGALGGEGGLVLGALFAPSGEIGEHLVDLGANIAGEDEQHRDGVDCAEEQGGTEGAGGVGEDLFIQHLADVAARTAGEVVADLEEIHHGPQAGAGGERDDHRDQPGAAEVTGRLEREVDQPCEENRKQPRARTEAVEENVNALGSDPAHRILGPNSGGDMAALERIVGDQRD